MTDIMTVGMNSSMGSAFASAQYGMQQATQNVTQAAAGIAKQNSEPASQNMVSDLITLKTNTVYHEASAKVLRVADETVGQLIDTLA